MNVDSVVMLNALGFRVGQACTYALLFIFLSHCNPLCGLAGQLTVTHSNPVHVYVSTLHSLRKTYAMIDCVGC